MKNSANTIQQAPVAKQPRPLAGLIAIATAALMLTACASTVKPSDGAVAARNRLRTLPLPLQKLPTGIQC